jgi:pectate lyase
MKKSVLLVLCTFLAGLSALFGQTYYMTAPNGYGAGTMGGGNASPTTVTTYAALKTALTASGSAVILVSGTIDFSSAGMMKIVATNKTLIGLPGAKLTNTNQSVSGIFYFNTGSSNIIIRNLTFIGPGAWDNNGNDNLTIKPVNKLWVDHCDFQDGEDGNFDNSGATDNVTVSWCKFSYSKAPRAPGSGTTADHRFSDLIGGNASDYPSDGHYSITWENCWWSTGCVERMPRARNAELHILNCYYTSPNAKVPIGIGGGAKNSTCYVENCDFSKLSVSPIFKDYSGNDGGSVALTFSGCLNNSGSASSAASKPSYSYTTYSVANVAAAVSNASCGAGATLKVTSSGVISSSCGVVTDIESTDVTSSSSVVYPNPSAGSFSVKGREQIQSISIVSTSGETVYTADNIQGNEAEISTNLEQGIYFVKIQHTSGAQEVIKFLRTK